MAAWLGGSEQDIVRNAIPPRRPNDVITAHLHLRLNKRHNNCLRYVRNHLRSGNGSWPQSLTHNPPFAGHFVDLLTSDGHHLGALGGDGGVRAHQATFTS